MDIKRLDTKEEVDRINIKDNSLVVVIDTCMFSSTVISLFDCNVSQVNVFKDYEETDYAFGGEDFGGEHEESFEFGNYPQAAYGKKRDFGKVVGFTSDNGAVCCHKVKNKNPSSEIIIASSINMKSVSNYIKRSSKSQVVIIQSGSHNNFQLEDSITSGIICQYLRGETPRKINLLEKHMEDFVKERYPWVPEEDVQRISNFNKYNIIPQNNSKSKEEYIKFKRIKDQK